MGPKGKIHLMHREVVGEEDASPLLPLLYVPVKQNPLRVTHCLLPQFRNPSRLLLR